MTGEEKTTLVILVQAVLQAMQIQVKTSMVRSGLVIDIATGIVTTPGQALDASIQAQEALLAYLDALAVET